MSEPVTAAEVRRLAELSGLLIEGDGVGAAPVASARG